jgi:P4 family phage/plasmid primase-like protien
MGDDSRKRTVNQIFRGKSMMYKVNQIDFNASYIVNGDHILVLRIINSKIINELEKYLFKFRDTHFFQEDGYYYMEVKLEDYLKIDDKYKKYLYGYKRKILDNHAYNNDYIYYLNNALHYNQKNIKKLCYQYDINDINRNNTDYILVDVNLYENIKSFRLNKRIILLETIITDNSEINIKKVNDVVLDEIIKLCHSVGYHTIIYEDVIKIFKNSIPLSRINIQKMEEDEFYGFEINGNHRYMMDDGTITHNSNGKSITVDMLNNALGDFAAEVQITLLTRKRPDATAPNPELARTKGKRFVTLQEPENTDTLQIGYLKSLTGGAKVSTRTLNEKTFEFEPQFKLFLLCNKVPEIPSNDGGTWRRVRVTPYEMKFVDNPTKVYEKKADRDLKEKIKTDAWRESLLAFLIHHYESNVANKPIVEPQKVLKYTKMYQDISDVYQNFLNDRVQLTNNNRDKVSYKQLYEEFKTWFQLTRNVRTTVKASEFKIEIINKMPPDAVKVQSQFIKGLIIKPGDAVLEQTNKKNNKEEAFNDDDDEDDDDDDDDEDDGNRQNAYV